MPRGLVRYQKTGDLHHVNFCCYHRLPYLRSVAAKELFEQALETMRLRYDFFVTAYVVMPDHVHFLVSEPKRATLATAVQAIKLSVSVRRGERPFWQKRYFDRNVWSEPEVVKTRRYIHRNPVRSELVVSPDLWRWSSFNHWWTGKPGPVEIESHWTARKRGGLGMILDADGRAIEAARSTEEDEA